MQLKCRLSALIQWVEQKYCTESPTHGKMPRAVIVFNGYKGYIIRNIIHTFNSF